MKRIVTTLLSLVSIMVINAQNYIESTNYASDDIISKHSDLQIVRKINGGTVFKINYKGEWPIEMKGAFEYACKIWEEVIPPCLPITIQAEIGNIRGSGSMQALSKVSLNTYTDFGWVSMTRVSPLTQIKRVTLMEYEKKSNLTYINFITDSTFFDNPSEADIKIIYNINKLNDFNFSIAPNSTDKYDFVTVALRDIATGLGFTSSIRINPLTNNSLLLSDEYIYTPFENAIANALKTRDPAIAYNKATSGSLIISDRWANPNPPIELYAPNTWVNGVSLNTFIPNGSHKITELLDYNFGRGCVIRDISDEKFPEVFRELLKWQDNVLTGGSPSASTSTDGSNSNKLPYNGKLKLNIPNKRTSSNKYSGETIYNKLASNTLSNDIPRPTEEVYEYCEKFHPLYNNIIDYHPFWLMSILKKDGTWDAVCHVPPLYPLIIDMNDFVFHYPDSIYARTCDGYLRGRLSKCEDEGNQYSKIFSHYFVIDYTPQTIQMKLSSNQITQMNQKSSLEDSNVYDVRIGLKNLEGITKVVIERKREGARVPSKLVIDDFKNGYFITPVEKDIRTTFTAIGYNENGYTRSLPLTIEPITSINERYQIVKKQDLISFKSKFKEYPSLVKYEILNLSNNDLVPISSGTFDSNQSFPSSNLQEGFYIINCYDEENLKYTYKIKI